MFQRAPRPRDASHAATRAAPHPEHHIANAIGKASLVPRVAPHFGPADAYTYGIETARREVLAVRKAALPALIKALRSKAPALEKQIECAKAAMQVRHLLMSANQHIFLLEKAATHRDPMLEFLRREIDTLVARAFRLGAYRGFEHLRPQGYKDPFKPAPARARLAARPTDHKHEPAPNRYAAQQPAALRRRRPARSTTPTRIRLQPARTTR